VNFLTGTVEPELKFKARLLWLQHVKVFGSCSKMFGEFKLKTIVLCVLPALATN